MLIALNIVFAIVVAAFFIVPSTIQWFEGQTRRESIYLASMQALVNLGIFAVIIGAFFLMQHFWVA